MIANLKDSQAVTIFGQKCPIEGWTLKTWYQSDNYEGDEDEDEENLYIRC